MSKPVYFEMFIERIKAKEISVEDIESVDVSKLESEIEELDNLSDAKYEDDNSDEESIVH